MKGVLLALWLATPVAQSTVVERIVAQVNGEIITESEVKERELTILNELYRLGLGQQELEQRAAEARATVLGDMIHELLLTQKAEELGITVTADQVDQVIQSIMDANDIADSRQLELRLQSEGVTLASLRENVETRTLIEKVKQFEIAARVVVTDDEIDRFYAENQDQFRLPSSVRLREIVLLTQDRKRDVVLREIQEVAGLLRNGADFAELATFFSQAPSADHGGDMGVIDMDTLSPEIREASARLEPGEVSPPVETRFGFHLLKLEERRESKLRPLNEVRSEIRNMLQQKSFAEAMEEYMKSLRKRAYIKVFPTPPGAREYPASPQLTEG